MVPGRRVPLYLWRYIMFNKTSAALVLGLGLMGAQSGAFAAATSGTFNVNVTLTPLCQIVATGSPVTTIGDIALSYTAFQTSAATNSTNFQVRCTTGVSYGMALDSASLTDGLSGLDYTLNLTSSSTFAAATNASMTGLTGAGTTAATYYIHANIPANQAGTTPGVDNKLRTLTITY